MFLIYRMTARTNMTITIITTGVQEKVAKEAKAKEAKAAKVAKAKALKADLPVRHRAVAS